MRPRSHGTPFVPWDFTSPALEAQGTDPVPWLLVMLQSRQFPPEGGRGTVYCESLYCNIGIARTASRS